MRHRTGLLSALLLVAFAGCSGITTHVDYDRNADFDSYKTFAWADTKETSMEDSSQLMHRRTVDAIQSKLQSGGLRLVQSNPDLWVTYHTNEKEELQVNTSSFGYGYGAGWYYDPYWGYGGGMGGSTTTVTSYTRGTLILDIWDAKTKNLVFRGTVEKVVSENPEKAAADIYKAIDAMAAEFRKKRAKEGA